MRGDAESAREQYAALEPHGGTLLVLLGTACDRVLGLLAGTVGDLETAIARLEAARAFCERAECAPEAARATFELADALAARGADGDRSRAHELRKEARASADV